MGYQLLSPASGDRREAIKASIERYGISSRVLVDEHGNIIDGHTRTAIAEELGIQVPREVRSGLTEEEKENLSVEMNALGREMSMAEKKAAAVGLRARGWSYPRIAEVLGIGEETARRALGSSSGEPDSHRPSTVTGKDGKSYPARRKRKADDADASPKQPSDGVKKQIALEQKIRDNWTMPVMEFCRKFGVPNGTYQSAKRRIRDSGRAPDFNPPPVEDTRTELEKELAAVDTQEYCVVNGRLWLPYDPIRAAKSLFDYYPKADERFAMLRTQFSRLSFSQLQALAEELQRFIDRRSKHGLTEETNVRVADAGLCS